MRLQDIIETLELEILTDPSGIKDQEPQYGYASDMLSCVMAAAKAKSLWVTLQAHLNIVAVATLLELTAIIITEGNHPEPEVVKKANQESIVLLATQNNTFQTAGKLWELGIRA